MPILTDWGFDMGYYPDVHPGDDVDNSAERENDVRHLLNKTSGFRDGVNRARLHSVRIPVWNLTPYTINEGTLVYVVVTSDMCGDAFPVAPLNYNPYDPQFLFDDAPFGVLETSLKAKDTGSLVLSGTVKVSITAGTAGNFAKPVPTGGFERGREGFRILHLNGTGTDAIILVGDYRMPDYTAGVGISKDELSGGTISTALVQGSNVTLTTDPDTGAITISATGSTSGGGGGLEIPVYSELTISGTAPEFGFGHTFILAVKAGNVGFWDEGGGAVGKWVSIDGSTAVSLTNKTAYPATEDGYLRISVVDTGSAPGECLSFFSPTGGLPLYKYGFMVSGIEATVSGGTASVTLTGGTGSVKFVGDGIISVESNTNGEIVIKGSTASITSEYSSQVGTIALKLTNGGGVVYLVPGNNITITQVYANTYTISATGGGGGSDTPPFWKNLANNYDTDHNQTIVELYTKFGNSTASGYIPNNGSFTPQFDSEVYCFARIKSSGNEAAVHVTVNGAEFKVCSVLSDSGVTIGAGRIIRVRAGQSININVNDGGNASYALIGMVCYEKGLDTRFAPS